MAAESACSQPIKVILLGDSAVGKSKYRCPRCVSLISVTLCLRLVERFLMDGYEPHQDSTYALTLYRYNTEIEGKSVAVGALKPAQFASKMSHPQQIFGTLQDKSASIVYIPRTIMLLMHAFL
jgi:hypothetical protein